MEYRPVHLRSSKQQRMQCSNGGSHLIMHTLFIFFFQAEDGIRDLTVTGVQTCALPILIRGLTLVFSQGKLTGMTAASGLAPLQATYDAAGSGKDRFGVIDIGLNPEVDLDRKSVV